MRSGAYNHVVNTVIKSGHFDSLLIDCIANPGIVDVGLRRHQYRITLVKTTSLPSP